MTSPAVLTEGLGKRFGDVEALADLDLDVAPGQVVGLLGHNGAGKTTAIRILATLLRPDAGRAFVGGHDVVRDPGAVREQIALANQEATLDKLLTGRENLVLFGRLQRLRRADAIARTASLLERFDLLDAADRTLATYSGGMRRRLDLAACLMVPRPVIFLDEPSTGLDPVSRVGVWEAIRTLVDDGTTLLLTTQNLDEADRLADAITVLARGRVVATGTPAELKDRVGARRVEVVVADRAALDRASAVLARPGEEPEIDERARRVSVAAPGGPDDLAGVLRALADAGVVVEEAALRRPTLDDAFFALTGDAPPPETETEDNDVPEAA